MQYSYFRTTRPKCISAATSVSSETISLIMYDFGIQSWKETCPTNPTMHWTNFPRCTILSKKVRLVHCGICGFAKLAPSFTCRVGKRRTGLGWGLLSQFPPFRYFPKFSALSKHTLTKKYHVHIWQVSLQLSFGDTGQIWSLFIVSNQANETHNGNINFA